MFECRVQAVEEAFEEMPPPRSWQYACIGCIVCICCGGVVDFSVRTVAFSNHILYSFFCRRSDIENDTEGRIMLGFFYGVKWMSLVLPR
jgi:hypothetical protein